MNLFDNPLMLALGKQPKPLIMAHRGNSAHCPENTLPAFQRAIDEGANIIETDLHVSADGELMCIHDATVDRTTNGQGAVAAMTCGQLQQLRADRLRPGFTDAHIPTLREVLLLLPENVAIGLELKTDTFLHAQTCLKLWELLTETHTNNRAFVLSFSQARLDAVRRYAPRLPTGLIALRAFRPPRTGEFSGLWWPFLFLNPFYVRMATKSGQLVCPLDPKPEPRLWYYQLLACDAVLTNDPAKTLRALGRKRLDSEHGH